ncbi:MAG: FAD:protein FMN transferase [Candidatus Omnitrophica bacterium]|nr:FAD:protein FMN transferase [Candidatus Omnitrophota bacterium]
MGKGTIKKIAFLFAPAILFVTPLNSFAIEALLMDTFVEIIIKDKRADSKKLEREAEALMKNLEKKFNYHEPESEISRINRISPGERFAVSENMYDALTIAKKINKATHGAFDAALGTGIWSLDPGTREIFFDTESVNLNLGGFAKGFIVDEGIKFLAARGVENAMINAGGDLYCLGDSDGEAGGWNIGIRDPLEPKRIIASFTVRNEGVATSGDYERHGHIVDPHTGEVAKKKAESVTVVAKDCAISDALATALYILGPEEGLSTVEAIKGAECYIIGKNGETYVSSGFKQMGLTKVGQ